MAVRVITDLLCDLHILEDVEVTEDVATTPPISLNGGKPLVMDLCKPCRTDYLDPFLDLLNDNGRPADGKNRSAPPKAAPKVQKAEPQVKDEETEPVVTDLGANVCPDCNHTFNTARGLNLHWSRMHGKAAEEAKAAEGEHECPDCGKTFARAQGLGAHRARTHGYRAGDDAA